MTSPIEPKRKSIEERERFWFGQRRNRQIYRRRFSRRNGKLKSMAAISRRSSDLGQGQGLDFPGKFPRERKCERKGKIFGGERKREREKENG